MNPITERRSGKDRRVASKNVTFPMRDRNGILIMQDRRISTDRRIEGLEVTLADMPSDTFNQYFKKFQKNEPE